MRILVLGDSNSIWQKEFIQYVLRPYAEKVVCACETREARKYDAFYREAGIELITPKPVLPLIMKIPKLRALIINAHLRKALKKNGPYDAIIDLFVSPYVLAQMYYFSRKGSKTYAYFCGSDVIRSSWLDQRLISLLSRRLSATVFASLNVRDAYIHKVAKVSNLKSQTIHFGMSNLHIIDEELKNCNVHTCKELQNISKEKTTICVGYSGAGAQNHLKVLEQLAQLPQDIKSRITVLLPMTYGGSVQYIRQVETAAESMGCEYMLYRQYMDRRQMARLWCSTDIIINAQLSDGISASVMEAMYAGAIVLNAAWLHYKEYDDWGLEYLSFTDYKDLYSVLLKQLNAPYTKKLNNNGVIKEKMSWDQCRHEWITLLEEERILK